MGEALKKSSERRIAPRFQAHDIMPIDIKLIGSSHYHRLQTVNLSASGLLLEGDFDISHYNKASIFDVCLYINGEKEPPVKFLGKYVRQESRGSIGIAITEIDGDDQNRYYDYLEMRSRQEII